MRRYLTIFTAAVALLAVVGASFAFAKGSFKTTTVRQGNLKTTFGGGFSPQKLPKKKASPISLKVLGKIRTVDGTHAPALKTFNLETDKNGFVNTKGYPTCRSGQITARKSKDAKKVCKKALIGTGKTTVGVEFADQPEIDVDSELLVFNGGTKGKTTTFYIHAFFNAPITGAIVTTVKIKKIHKGRYGTLAEASIPEIANGAGSVKFFKLNVNKKYKFKGKRYSILNLKCRDGKVRARGEAKFDDGTKMKGSVLLPCTPKG